MKPYLAPWLAALCTVTRLCAHECWLQPSSFAPAVGTEINLAIHVGMDFRGEAKPFNPERVKSLRLFTPAGVTELHPPLDGRSAFGTAFGTPGTKVIAYDSPGTLITLEAEKFNAYLREEGLDSILALREQAGEAARPGRERYRRSVKTLIQAGGRPDAGFAVRTGQPLELVPLDNPALVRPGGTLRVLLLLGSQPLGGGLLQAWHRAGDRLTLLNARTSAAGEAAFTLPFAGEWMISTVHMQRTAGDPAADWESLWGNLTFAVAAPAADASATHPVKGVILGLMPDQSSLLVKHEDVPGVMRAMTMVFKVDAAVFQKVQRKDAITARMSRRADGWWLTDIEVVPPKP